MQRPAEEYHCEDLERVKDPTADIAVAIEEAAGTAADIAVAPAVAELR